MKRKKILYGVIVLLIIFASTGFAYADTTYTIQRGDTLYGIALKFGTTVQAIVSANGLTNPDIIYAGQTLVMDKETGKSWAIRGAEAVVWDLLAVGHSYRGIVPLLSLILSLSTDEAESTLAGLLRKWREAGIVRVRGESDDG